MIKEKARVVDSAYMSFHCSHTFASVQTNSFVLD